MKSYTDKNQADFPSQYGWAMYGWATAKFKDKEYRQFIELSIQAWSLIIVFVDRVQLFSSFILWVMDTNALQKAIY